MTKKNTKAKGKANFKGKTKAKANPKADTKEQTYKDTGIVNSTQTENTQTVAFIEPGEAGTTEPNKSPEANNKPELNNRPESNNRAEQNTKKVNTKKNNTKKDNTKEDNIKYNIDNTAEAHEAELIEPELVEPGLVEPETVEVETVEVELIEPENKNKSKNKSKGNSKTKTKTKNKNKTKNKTKRTPNNRHDSIMQEYDEEKDYDLGDIQQPKKRAFLKAIEANGCNITKASKIAGVDQAMHYYWNSCPVYRQVFEKQRQRSITALETEAIKRAVEGERDPVFHQGQVVGHRVKKSDNLLMFIMKELKPSYKDNYQEGGGNIFNNSGQVNIQFNIPRPE